jgi:broad specificity phosphatase PhoE
MTDVKKSILLVRHGTTAWNAENRLQGRIDNPLSEAGRCEAQKLAARLRAEEIDLALVSPLKRARETAEILVGGRGVPLKTVSEFVEIDLGEWEGRLYPEVIAADPEQHRRWLEEPDRPVPGGESFAAVCERVGPALARLLEDGPERLLIVGHATVNRAILGRLLGLPPQTCRLFRSANASLSRLLTYESGGHRRALVEQWNCVAHLEPTS